MNNKKGNPQILNKYNSERKNNTLRAIRLAVQELNQLGLDLSIKNVMNFTNLSRSAFQQEHIISLMKELKIGKYSKTIIENVSDVLTYDNFLLIEKKLTMYKQQIDKQKKNIIKLENKNTELVRENEILRNEVYKLQLEKELLFPINQINK